MSASARRCCERGECDRPVQHSPASVALQRSLGPLQPFSILVARQHGTRLVARTRGQRWHYRWRGLDHMRKYLTPMPAHRRGRTRSARDRELPSIERGRCLILQALCPPFATTDRHLTTAAGRTLSQLLRCVAAKMPAPASSLSEKGSNFERH